MLTKSVCKFIFCKRVKMILCNIEKGRYNNESSESNTGKTLPFTKTIQLCVLSVMCI